MSNDVNNKTTSFFYEITNRMILSVLRSGSCKQRNSVSEEFGIRGIRYHPGTTTGMFVLHTPRTIVIFKELHTRRSADFLAILNCVLRSIPGDVHRFCMRGHFIQLRRNNVHTACHSIVSFRPVLLK